MSCASLCNLGIYKLVSWMCIPLTCRVRQLDIYAHLQIPAQLPPALFSCQTLEVLKLNVYLDLELPSSVCLPHEDDSLARLVSSYPSLEHVDLYGCWNPANPIKISSSSLRR